MSFYSYVPLGSNLVLGLVTRNTSKAPLNSDALPTYRIYGPGGLMAGGIGTFAIRDAGTVTGASNASPIVVTSASHGLTTGTVVTLSGVGGNTAANGTFTCTKVDSNTFSLNGSTGNAPYTSGGTFAVSGLYQATVAITIANNYISGSTYDCLASYAVSGASMVELSQFIAT